ncbi:adenosylcobinamide-GDP ribazoletransferase [Ferrovibrio sp.]|uniref:adenosylcobinamide-GDP ribazoletransferase n=1 Tax=Ferrovibrio sp. TaxID=1917215 RepID=UPI003513AF07
MTDSNTPPDDTAPRRAAVGTFFDQFRIALSLLTRLPVPLPREPVSLSATVWAFPLIGVLVGLAGGVVFFVANRFGLGNTSAALLTLGCQILLTGGLHEDGLADTADGFGGGRIKDRKLEIMRDSRIGTYGVLALLLVFGLRFAVISELAGSLASISGEYDETVSQSGAIIIALVVSGALSRAAMTALWYALPPARQDGLSAVAGKVGAPSLVAGLVIAAGISFLLLDAPLVVASLAAATSITLIMSVLSVRQVGGHTGDILGATQQISEVAILLAISAATISV